MTATALPEVWTFVYGTVLSADPGDSVFLDPPVGGLRVGTVVEHRGDQLVVAVSSPRLDTGNWPTELVTVDLPGGAL